MLCLGKMRKLFRIGCFLVNPKRKLGRIWVFFRRLAFWLKWVKFHFEFAFEFKYESDECPRFDKSHFKESVR